MAFCFAACGARAPMARPYSEGRESPPEIEKACDLTAHRCSKCHPLERLKLSQVDSPAHWQSYVERMRLQPESGIAETECPTIVSCLVFQRFGQAGLESLRKRGVSRPGTRPRPAEAGDGVP